MFSLTQDNTLNKWISTSEKAECLYGVLFKSSNSIFFFVSGKECTEEPETVELSFPRYCRTLDFFGHRRAEVRLLTDVQSATRNYCCKVCTVSVTVTTMPPGIVSIVERLGSRNALTAVVHAFSIFSLSCLPRFLFFFALLLLLSSLNSPPTTVQRNVKYIQVLECRFTKKTKTKLRGLSPQANYTDRATAASRRI
jgi:hypothetical protein